MSGPPRLACCAICNRPRPGTTGTPGLEARLGADRVAQLCEACAAEPGRARAFLDAVRGLYSEAVIASTTAPSGVVAWSPLALAPEAQVSPAVPPSTAAGAGEATCG